jgi:hypothetical protein
MALMLLVGWEMMEPWYENTRFDVEQTHEAWKAVDYHYRKAVQAICRQHGAVTLADLQSASRDWGFEWRPSLIADTNRMPRCSDY